VAAGDIGPVIGTGIFDATVGTTPSIVHVSGDVYAIAYRGPGADGWLRTITINSAGNITILPHTLEFDAASGYAPRIIHVTGDIFAITYWQLTLDNGIVRTVPIDSAGNIGAVMNTLTFDAVRGRDPDIVHVSGEVYAIAYNGAGDRGLLCTISIDNAGNIAFKATLTFDNTVGSGHTPDIIHISGDVYAIVYTDEADRGIVCTVTIDSAGNIAAAAERQYDGFSNDQRIVHVAGDVYAIAYTFFTGVINIGRVSTVSIDDAGNIGVSVIGSFDFDVTKGINPNIIHISGNIFGIAYRGVDDDGYLITLTISEDGTTIALTGSSLEFDEVFTDFPQLIHIGDVYAIAYTGPGVPSLGYVKTIDIEGAAIPLYHHHINVRNINLPYEDKDKTKELHMLLKNLSPTAKNAGADGEVVIGVKYEPAA